MKKIDFEKARLICIDWGTSNFRAFLLDEHAALLGKINSDQGMMDLKPTEFEPCLLKLLNPWLKSTKTPIIMAGMVGSLRGWQNTKYLTCPVNAVNLADNVTKIKNTHNLDISIISGIENPSSAPQYDVARGEETQVIGALAMTKASSQSSLVFCLPGTHSKWMKIKQGNIEKFSTHMTGEVFSILIKHSILAPQKPHLQKKTNNIFLNGLDCSSHEGGLVHHIFSARTNMLNGVLTNDDIENYLSGILIGAEINEMKKSLPEINTENNGKVYLVGNSTLSSLYSTALSHLGVSNIMVDGEVAAYTGMFNIAKSAQII